MSGQVVDRVATTTEHAALARSVGWQGHFDDHVIAASLEASIAGVVYEDFEHGVIGMARAVGDGLQYAYVQDVIVHPDHNGRGIATKLMTRLLELLQPKPGAELFIGLFASDEAKELYASLGFSTDGATGMFLRAHAS
jgi:ribosomal protein S18 acetylase RimI-like enzyme